MYYFIEEISKGMTINWAKIISDNLNFQLRGLEKTQTSSMTSYLVYVLARFVVYNGLICNELGQYKVYECYSQLHMSKIEYYKRVNKCFHHVHHKIVTRRDPQMVVQGGN